MTDEADALRARIRDLEAVLNQNNKTLAVTFKLTPSLNNLFGLLLSLPNVTPEMIQQRLEIATDAKVAIHRLRKHLTEFSIEIKGRRNLGYWLEQVDKDKIRRLAGLVPEVMVTPEVTLAPDQQMVAE